MLSLVVSLLLLARLACCVGIQNPDSEASEKPSNVRQQKVAGDGAWPPPPVLDTRYIASSTHSTVMLQEAYLDQPYCVVSTSAFKTENHTSRVDDEAAASVRWVCVITADKFHEGGTGEHVVSIYSDDYGKTWSKPVPLEAKTTLANAYSTIAVTSYGRIYAMYNFNSDNVTKLPDGKPLQRQDELGHFVMKYSDDRGESWSDDRYEVPYRLTSIDTNNSFHGTVKIMWSVDQTKVDGHGTLLYSFTKIGVYPQNAPEETFIDKNNTWHGRVKMMWSVDQCTLSTDNRTVYYSFTKIGQYAYSPPEEIWFLASDNILTEKDASKVTWRLLPDGDHGIPPPGGNPNIAEEGHIMPMPNGNFYSIFRTTQGLLAACSSVGGSAAKWNDCNTVFAQYQRSITSRPAYLKNPRGPITMKKFSNGRYLLLFYNNGNSGFYEDSAHTGGGAAPDSSRNPYWLSAGSVTENSSIILWSQPEIIIYDRVMTRPGYPDFLEIPSTGQIFITETQKTIARIHEINSVLLEVLWTQETSTVVAKDIGAQYTKSPVNTFSMASLPTLGNFTRDDGLIQGFTLIMWLAPLTDSAETLMTAYEHDYHKGIGVSWSNKTVNFTASDAQVLVSCTTDSICSERLQATSPNAFHQLAVTVDNGPMMITLIVDGVLCDGAKDRVRGSCWMNNQIRDVNGLAKATAGLSVNSLLLYSRALFNSEVVANYNNMTQSALFSQ